MKIAITGADLITSVGAGRDAHFRNLCAGVSGNKPLQHFQPEHFRVQRAYEIAEEGADPKGRVTRWLTRCVEEAVRQSGLDLRTRRVAFLVGTGLRELSSLEQWWADKAPMHVSELHFGGALQRTVDAVGPSFSFSNACAASNFALGLGADLLQLGEADAVVVAGCDTITESMFGLLDRVNPVPPERVQPFDRNRRGVIMGDGAAAVVMEPADSALARGKAPLALVRAVGMSCDAHHETAPHLEGIIAAMVDAHQRAGVTPTDIDLLMVHGTGTFLNDQVEAQAISQYFGDATGRCLVSAIKSMTGHTSGASGLVGVITAIDAINRGCVPPTIGLTEVIPEAESLNFVTGGPRQSDIRLAQINAFGFGGVNAVVIVERAG